VNTTTAVNGVHSEAAFHETFRLIHPIAKRLVLRWAGGKRTHLGGLLLGTLEGQSSTEYPFVLTFAFCRRQRDAKHVERLAAATHLLQTSTLVTDDIFDGADSRYYRQTICRKYGASYAVLAAELLQSIAMECIAEEVERPRFSNRGLVLTLFQRVVKELYLGQYLDVYYTGKAGTSLRAYYRVIALGAGNFLAHMAQCGALLANKPAAEISSLKEFGYNYGMALFITDDIVDVVHSPGKTGKNFATDLRQRRVRLPLLMALQLGSRETRRWLRRFLRHDNPLPAEIVRTAALIEDTGSLDACKRIANRYLAKSLQALSGVESKLTREHLGWLSESLLRAQGLT
jgi:geranylgeranyl pyrophosphate synthase